MAVQKALLGLITPSVRAVTIEYLPSCVRTWFYVNGPVEHTIAPDDLDDFLCEMEASLARDRFPPPVEYRVVRCDSPQAIEFVGDLVYLRKEDRSAT